MLRTTIMALTLAVAFAGCKKPKGGGETLEPTKNPEVSKGKTVPAEVAEALAKAQAGCTKAHSEADPDKVKALPSYDAATAQKTYEDECKTPLEMVIGKEATLAAYKGEINGKTYDVAALKKMADDTPGRLEIAKTTYEEALKAKKEEEKKIWEPLLKADKLKTYQEKGIPTSSNATATTPEAIAAATMWIYESAPRDNNGKQVVDTTTYTFKKDGKLASKPKAEVKEYIAPE